MKLGFEASEAIGGQSLLVLNEPTWLEIDQSLVYKQPSLPPTMNESTPGT
jgi:hypothetical protein